ncbi:hypothetical protein IM697_00225 [Streptomyces ferrugineus]|uniref:Uncharacterized protein n=1 Tax=Streptomyces ferrugineus TaxID=1413221 RepID=A0A7M2T116_9ACTN|nr:DUF6415 family natural product biosynthesis protein [Streptomyces ferrugineus]QOV41595.1 hypothetical protein IM697_00225 [Streptomyces ferrugineus]
MNTAQEEADTYAPNPATMRSAASWFLDQRTLPRHETLKLWHRDLDSFLQRLIPAIEELAASRPPSDVPARVALVGVGKAKRRLHEPEAAGLHGETERAMRLARSVVALCDHHATLTGAVMCLACDKPIKSDEASVPYGSVSPFGGAKQSGRIHVSCASTKTEVKEGSVREEAVHRMVVGGGGGGGGGGEGGDGLPGEPWPGPTDEPSPDGGPKVIG